MKQALLGIFVLAIIASMYAFKLHVEKTTSLERMQEQKTFSTIQTGLRISTIVEAIASQTNADLAFPKVSNLVSGIVAPYESFSRQRECRIVQQFDGTGGWVLEIPTKSVRVNSYGQKDFWGISIAATNIYFKAGQLFIFKSSKNIEDWLAKNGLERLKDVQTDAIHQAVHEILSSK